MSRCLPIPIQVIFLLLYLARVCPADTFTNPVIANGADPWVVFHNGYYFLTYTTGSGVVIYRSTQLAGTNGLAHAPVFSAFYPPGPYNTDVWAPELHFINGKAYVYYAADDLNNNVDHRMFVAEAADTGTNLTFIAKGKIYDSTTDRWAIDGTVLEATNGALYFIWSGWPGTQDGLQNLYIAPMSDPLTISGPRVLIATPNHGWESWIEEGPEVLQHEGKTFIVYSGNQSWTDNECLGWLENTDGNYLNPASWAKSSGPVFATYTAATVGVFGPGHCSFTKSLDGSQDWIVYHAAKYSGAGWNRDIRMQPFSWNTDGSPNLGHPIPAGVAIPVPSGDNFTPARFDSITPQADGSIRMTLAAPLPLRSNQWSVQFSNDLARWTTITNVPGLQYQIDLADASAGTNRFYRVQSFR